MEASQCQTTVLLLKCCEHWHTDGRYFWESAAQGTLYEPHIKKKLSLSDKRFCVILYFGLNYYQNCHCTFKGRHNLSHLIQETLFLKCFPLFSITYSCFILWYGQEVFIALITLQSYSVLGCHKQKAPEAAFHVYLGGAHKPTNHQMRVNLTSSEEVERATSEIYACP